MTGSARELAQRHRDTIFVEDGVVDSIVEFPGEQFIMRIRAPKCAANATAGSFVHVSCDETLPMRRPLSIMRTVEDSIEVLYKTVGYGLHLLARKQPGDPVNILGPIGQPFTFDSTYATALLIGGGVGIPPMVFAADVLRNDKRCQPFAILGSEIPFPFKIVRSDLAVAGVDDSIWGAMPLLDDWGVPSRLTSEAGFEGCYDGIVTGLAEAWLGSLANDTLSKTAVYACGPTPMLKAVAELASKFNLPCQVSLEEFMACAVGGCAGCTVRVETPQGLAMKRVCVDGPVFDAASIAW